MTKDPKPRIFKKVPKEKFECRFSSIPGISSFRILAFFVFGFSGISASAERQPNIVLIFADDLGYGDVGCYGATHVDTPHIDSLAAEGRRFTDAHSASATCSPSRYALLTGRYPARENLFSPVFLRTPLIIDPDRTTIADLAKEQGYATACIGKWHLGWGDQNPVDWNVPLKPGPNQLGFDYYYGIPVVNSHAPFVYVENDRVVGLTSEDPLVYGRDSVTRDDFDEKMQIRGTIGGADAAHRLYDDEAVGTVLTEKATGWIREQATSEKPFLLYFATTNIHHPFTPAKRFRGTSRAGIYGDFIHELDWIVGEVVKTLEEAGVAGETLIVFTSDNGGMLNRGGQEARRLGHKKNGDLLGFKFDVWEGGHRVPFIVKWPDTIPAGTESGALVSNVDLMATLGEIFERPLGTDEGEDSFSLLPAFTGEAGTEVREHLLYAPSRKSHLGLRSGDWVYIPTQGHGGFGGKSVGDHGLGGAAAHPFTGHVHSDIENGRYKPDAPKQQLYHLGEDPNQTKNVIRDHPEIAKALAAELREILAHPTAPHARTVNAADISVSNQKSATLVESVVRGNRE